MLISKALTRELADRRCIIFLGAGASAGCSGVKGQLPPTWKNLLTEAAERLKLEQQDKAIALELLNEGSYLNAAEVIFADTNIADAKDFFRDNFLTPRYNPKSIQEMVHKLDQKIVITTNYDVIYEKQCGPIDGENGYIVKRYYDEGILDEVRSPNHLIRKAHGCTKEPEKIILTRSQYYKIKKEHPLFYNALNSLFLTHTVLFIGCSLSDPDIQLILENTNIAVPCNHPHYAFMPEGEHPAIKKSIKAAYNIEFIEYKNTDRTHQGLVDLLSEVAQHVDALRATKDALK